MTVTCFGDAVMRSRLDRALAHHVAEDVSVIIPAKQEAPSIAHVIERTRRFASEIVVVVGRSTDGTGTIVGQRLYQLVRQKGQVRDRTVRVEFLDPGAQAFAFTFG